MIKKIKKHKNNKDMWSDTRSKYRNFMNHIVFISGFTAGFLWSIHDINKFVEFPLSTTFKSLYPATIYGIGTVFISGFIPDVFLILFPSIVSYSAYHHVKSIL
jgi:hypothetical protein